MSRSAGKGRGSKRRKEAVSRRSATAGVAGWILRCARCRLCTAVQAGEQASASAAHDGEASDGSIERRGASGERGLHWYYVGVSKSTSRTATPRVPHPNGGACRGVW